MIWKPHATVAAIIEHNNKFLMVEELIQGVAVFNQPAGHLEPDESIIDAVIRETREETAWQFVPEAIIGIYLWKHPENGETYLRVAICGSCKNHDAQQPLDKEIIQSIWMSRHELLAEPKKLRSPMVINCCEMASAILKTPPQ